MQDSKDNKIPGLDLKPMKIDGIPIIATYIEGTDQFVDFMYFTNKLVTYGPHKGLSQTRAISKEKCIKLVTQANK